MEFKDLKKDFPWFKNNPNLVYLDNAATTLKPQCMIDAVQEYYTKYSTNPHSDNTLALYVNEKIEQTRKTLAQFIQADKEEVMFTSGATEGINTIANAMEDILQKGDEIILTYMEHASNLLPWYKLAKRIGVKLILIGKDESVPNLELFAKVLNKKTKLVAFANASNLIASKLDTKEIIQKIKQNNPNTFVLIDSTQYVEHYQLRCHELNCDFAVGSGHKIIGPTGTGFLYIKKDLFHKINPLKYGGSMNSEIFEDSFTFATNNYKFEGGTPNVAGLYAWNESLKYWLNLGFEEIEQREQALKQYFLKNMPKRDDLIMYSSDKSPLITFNFVDKEHQIVDAKKVEKFLEERNILIRSSLASAKLAKYPLKANSVIRASLLFYNDFSDMDKLIQALSEFKTE